MRPAAKRRPHVSTWRPSTDRRNGRPAYIAEQLGIPKEAASAASQGDVGAHKAVMITNTGYFGAIAAAKHNGIALHIVTPQPVAGAA